MHDVKKILEDPQLFEQAMLARGVAATGLGEKISLWERKRLDLLQKQENLQARRNSLSKEIGKTSIAEERDAKKKQVQELKIDLESTKEQAKVVESEITEVLLSLPNLALEDVPDGADESFNVEISREGEIPHPSEKRKEHFDIGLGLQDGMIDFELSAMLSGTRFVTLQGELARLERALSQMMLDTHVEDHGYTEMSVPVMVLPKIMEGTGQLPKFADDLFMTNSDSGHILIPTAEVPLTNIVREKIWDRNAFPMRFTAYTNCFRKEAGASGRDTRGMLRQHQFGKVELVSITLPEDAQKEHERMTNCAKEILRKLELPFREILLSKGDMGFAASRTIDLEVWLCGQQAYREISSCSVCGDFQARRMGARVRKSDGKGSEFLHTLNGSGVAVGRAMIAVLENGLDDKGGVRLPKSLHAYMGGRDYLAPQS